ncbi:MAG TPA: hypothetical protein VMS75_02660 [Terriglobales bacterium]|nr:hypothetical protein [Terriglobales bacterium]
MKTTTATLKILAALAVVLTLAGCNAAVKDAKSNSMLIVESLTGTTIDGTSALYLESDVSTTTSDTATVTLQAAMIDPGATTPSQYNNITVTGYKIDYTLIDGTGEPGVTVPASMEGTSSTLLITIGESKSVNFVAVLSAAKLVAPLVSLVGTTTRLQVIAHVTFMGVDGSNHPVQATGQLTIDFGDY